MQNLLLVRAAPLCAAMLALQGDLTHGFMVARRPPLDAAPPVVVDTEVVSTHYSGVTNNGVQALLFPVNDDEEYSFVQSSSDDENEGDDDKGKESHEGGESQDADKEKSEEGSKEGEDRKKEESKEEAEEETKEEAKAESKEKTEESKDSGAKPKESKSAKEQHENLLMSPQEQSKFIRQSMTKAASQSYKAMKNLTKVMDAVNAVVALINQLVHLPPPGPPFAETVLIETSGKKLSLKGILDETTQVRAKIDQLFIILSNAKYAIIGSINHAIPKPVVVPGKPA